MNILSVSVSLSLDVAKSCRQSCVSHVQRAASHRNRVFKKTKPTQTNIIIIIIIIVVDIDVTFIFIVEFCRSLSVCILRHYSNHLRQLLNAASGNAADAQRGQGK